HRPADGGVVGGGGQRNRRRGRVVEHRHGHGRRGRLVPGRVPGYGREGVRPVRGRGRVPRDRVGGGDVLGPEVSPVELELDADHPDIVACAGRYCSRRPGDGGVGGGGGQRHRRRGGVVEHRHGHHRRCRLVPGRVPGGRGQGVRPVGGGRGVP